MKNQLIISLFFVLLFLSLKGFANGSHPENIATVLGKNISLDELEISTNQIARNKTLYPDLSDEELRVKLQGKKLSSLIWQHISEKLVKQHLNDPYHHQL